MERRAFVSPRPILHSKAAGFPIGLAKEPYGELHLRLAAGDRLYLYSDGLADAMSPEGVPFGNARLLAAIDRERARSIADGITVLLDEIARWHVDVNAQDDISILAVEFAPCEPITPSPAYRAAGAP